MTNKYQTVLFWINFSLCYGERLFLFWNLLYFVNDLFPSITCRISMHSPLRVITSHPVSSPWLHLSSLYLFSTWYFLSRLLLVVSIWGLCWALKSQSSFLHLPSLSFTQTQTHTHMQICTCLHMPNRAKIFAVFALLSNLLKILLHPALHDGCFQI